MPPVTYTKNSPYYTTRQNSLYLDFYNPRTLTRDNSDTLYQIDSQFEKRPDLLSQAFYGTPNYWWVFQLINPDSIVDPIEDLTTGKLIYVPEQKRIQALFG